MVELRTQESTLRLEANDLRNRGLNRFKNWACECPQYSLNVTADGELTTGICRAWWLGNIFNNSLTHRPNEVRCPFEFCTAIPDINSPKRSETGQSISPNVSALSLNWDICRRCNFDCFYCTPQFHNKTDAFPTLEKLKMGWENFKNYLGNDLESLRTVHILGGEPTLMPNFLDFLSLLSNDKITIVTMSNGSNSTHFYQQLLNVSDLTISIHFQYLQLNAIFRKIHNLHQFINSVRPTGRLRLKIMAPPKMVNTAVDFRSLCESLEGELPVALEILKVKDPKTRLRTFLEYTPDELNLLNSF